jgi:hypothetical protein
MEFNLDYSQLQQLYPLIIPGLLGLVIPLLVNAVSRVTGWPPYLQSIIYAALSALAAVVPTVTFNSDLKGYLIQVFIAWMMSMRSHYTDIPNSLIPPYKPRHALLDEEDRRR